jgi:hypothetical protein
MLYTSPNMARQSWIIWPRLGGSDLRDRRYRELAESSDILPAHDSKTVLESRAQWIPELPENRHDFSSYESTPSKTDQ